MNARKHNSTTPPDLEPKQNGKAFFSRLKPVALVVIALAFALVFSPGPAFSQPAPVWHTADNTTANGTGTGMTINRPGNVATGNLIVVSIAMTANRTITPPAGFSLVQGTTSNQISLYVYTKIATASEPSTYTFTNNTSATWRMAAGRVSGSHPTSPVPTGSGNISDNNANNATSITLTGITTTDANSLLVAALGFEVATSGHTHTGMTQAWSAVTAPGNYGASQSIASAGATGTRSVNWTTGSRVRTIMFSINRTVPSKVILTGPSTSTAGSASGNFTLTSVDANDNPVVVNANTTFTLSSGSGGTHSFSSGTTVTIPSGQSSVNFTYTDTQAGLQTITASYSSGDSRLSSTSDTHQITVGPAGAAKLEFGVQPSAATMGGTISPALTVRVLDTYNNLVTTATNSISLAIANDASQNNDAILSGTIPVSASGGIATFSNLSIDQPGDGYTLQATSTGLTPVTSAAFDVNPVALRLQYLNSSTSPSSTTLSPFVRVYNDDNVAVALTDITIRYYFTSEPPGNDVFSNSYAAVGTANVVRQFVDALGVRYLEIGFTSDATVPGWLGGDGTPNNLPPAASTGEIQNSINDSSWGIYDQTNDYSWDPAFTAYADFTKITVYYKGILVWGEPPGSASGGVALQFAQQPLGTTAGTTISPPVTVWILDNSNNLLTDATDEVSISLANNPGNASLGGTLTRAAVNGVATFNDLKVSGAGTGYTLEVNSVGMAPATSGTFNITDPATVNLRLQYQNNNTNTSSTVLSPFVDVFNDDVVDVALTDITIRYWFVSEPPGTDQHIVDWAAVNKDYVTGSFSDLGAYRYLQIGFTSNALVPGYLGGNGLAGIFPAGASTGGIHQRILDSGGGTYDQTNDYSWDPNITTYADFNKITVYYKGNLVWGDPPDDMPSPVFSLISANPLSIQADGSSTSLITVQLKYPNGVNVTLGGDVVCLSTTAGSLSGSQGSCPVGHVQAADQNNGTYTATLTAGTLAATAVITGVLNGDAMSDDEEVTLTPGAATRLAFGQQPTNTEPGQDIAPPITVRIEDANGNLITGDNTTEITLAIGNNPSGGSLSGTQVQTVSSGVATFSNLSINTAGSGYTLVATSDPVYTQATSNSFNIVTGAATKLAFDVQPTNTTAGESISPAITVRILDNHNNLVANATDEVTLAILANPGSGTLSGTQTVAAVNGVATFNNLSINKTGSGYTLQATATGLAADTSDPFNITPAAATKLAFGVQPANTVAGVSITPAVTVRILDAFDNLVTSATDNISLDIENDASVLGDAVLNGTTTVAASGGIATFSNLNIQKSGTGYTLMATAASLDQAESAAFNITPAAANKLVFLQQPTNTVATQVISPAITVRIEDAFGNLRTSDNSTSVFIAIQNNPSAGSLSGTPTRTASGGIATFNDLTINNPGTGYTLSVTSSPALTAATSNAFNITAGAATKLAFGVQPSTATAGVAISPAVTVRILDANDNLVTTATDNITLAFEENAGDGTLSGTLTVAASAGVATFSNLSIDKAGTGYTLLATSGALTSAISNAFDINPGAAFQLAFLQQPFSSTAQETISPPVTVRVEDNQGNLITTAINNITLSIGTNPSGGTLAGTLTVEASGGVATFDNLSIDEPGFGYTLQANASGLNQAISSSFAILAPSEEIVETFNATGSITIPAGVTEVTVQAWGGGGRGGTRTNGGATAGGGGGAFTQSVVGVSPGSYTVTVGAGGNDSNINGGDSWFLNTSTVLAKGGAGVANNGTTGGAGGAAASGVGTTRYSGGSGSASGTNAGGGGSSAGYTANGNPGTISTGGAAPDGGGAGGDGATVNNTAGSPGLAPGGGGGGAKSTGNNVNAGGAGAPGRVIVRYTIPDPSPLTTTITAAQGSIPANGSSQTTITVQVKYPNGDNVPSGGDQVALFTTLGSLGSVTDNNNGTYTAVLTSGTTPGTAVITGTLNLAPITDDASVVFSVLPPVDIALTGPPHVQTGNQSMQFTITAYNELGQVSTVAGNTQFSLSSTNGGTAGFVPSSPVTIPAGQSSVQFTYSNTAAGLQTITAAYLSGDASLSGASDTHTIQVYPPVIIGDFDYMKEFQTDHTKVAGSSPLTDFTVLFRYTHPDFRHTSQGGLVEHFDGFDIVFTASDQTTVWDHNLESYNPTSGEVIAWVRFPSLSATANTSFYIHYGNGNVTNNLSRRSTFDNDYRLVLHLNDGVEDFSPFINGVTNNGTSDTQGAIGSGRTFGASDFIQADNDPSLNITDEITISLWVYPTNISGNPDLVTKGTYTESYSTQVKSNGELVFSLNGNTFTSTSTIGINNWYHLAFTKNSGGRAIYINGIPAGSGGSAPPIDLISAPLYVSNTAYPFLGIMDEVRISGTARSAEWVATKYANQSDPQAFLIQAINDPPVLSAIEAAPLSYTEGDGPVPITATIEVSDINHSQLAGATIQISGNYSSGQDFLGFADGGGISGSFNASNGTLTLSGTASLAAYQSALRSITYENTSQNPSVADRTISFTVTDGLDNSNTANRIIEITPVNQAPVLANIESTAIVYQPGDGQVVITQSITITDIDNTHLTGAEISITGNFDPSEDVLSFANQSGISGSWNSATGTLTLSGSADLASYQAALRAVKYQNTDPYPSSLNRTISFTVSDGQDPSNTISRIISFDIVGSFGGLVLWLRADDNTFQTVGGSAADTDGQPVRQWIDRSGAGHSFETAGTPPTLRTGVAEIGGRSAIEFAGTGDELADLNGGSYINGLDGFSIFMVIKSNQTDTDRGFWHTKVPDGQDDVFTMRYDAVGFYGSPAPVNNIKVGILSNAPENQIESYSDVQTTNGQVVMLQWSSGEAFDLYVDGILNNPALLYDPPTGSLSGATRALLGKSSKDGPTMSWDGMIAEVILYNRLLSEGERMAIEDYISDNYDISVRLLTPATGGEAISADDTGTNWTTLTGPIIKEGFLGQLTQNGTLVFKVPEGFEWDTTGSAPSVMVSPVFGGTTNLAMSFTSRTSELITFTVTQASTSPNRPGQAVFSNFRVRPTDGVLPNSGIIINEGTTGFAGNTNYGSLNVVPGQANHLIFTQQPTNVNINQAIAPAVRVQVRDQFGNYVEQAGIEVIMTLTEGTGSLYGTTTTSTNTEGEAVFSNLRVDETGNKTITASATGLTAIESDYFQVLLDGVFTTFRIQQLPSGNITGKTAGETFQISLEAVDGNGNIDPTFNGKAVITSNATLGTGGGATANFSNGILASHTISITSAGTGRFITATNQAGTETGQSNTFVVSPAAASVATSEISANPDMILNNGSSTSAISVQLKDAFGNNLTTGGNTVTMTTTAGTLGSVTNNNNGTYSATLTSSLFLETATITAAINGNTMANTEQVTFAEFNYIWQGTLGDAPTATQWHHAPNWNTGTVPGSGDAVLIPSSPSVGTQFPVVSINETTVGKILIQTGASLTLSGGITLIVEGDLSGSGSVINGSTLDKITVGGNLNVSSITLGTIEFNGSQQQTITNPHTYTNLIINSGNTVRATNNLTVNGTLTLTQGILRIPNDRVLIANTKSISGGQLQFVRHISGPKGWRMLGSPVASTYGDLLGGTLTQGFTGSTLGLESPPGTALQPNVFWYQESFAGTDNERWRAPASASDALTPGRGLFVYFFGDVAEDNRYNNALPDTLVVTGQEHEGNGTLFEFPVTYTEEGDQGWNFVSNPFGATLNWSSAGWTKTNIDNTIYVWSPSANSNNGEFLTWNGSSGTLGNGLIRPFQGFWVKATGPNPVLRVNKSAKTSGGTFYQKEIEDIQGSRPVIIFKATARGLEAHKTLTFTEGGKTDKDPMDGYRLLPMTTSFVELFSTLPDGSELVVNNLPRDLSNRLFVPLHIAGYHNGQLVTDPYTLSWPGLRGIPADWILTLIDNETGERMRITENSQYTFSINPAGTKTTYAGNDPGKNFQLLATNRSQARFTLVVSTEDIEENIPYDLTLVQNYPNPFSRQTILRFGLAEDSQVILEVYDLLGNRVAILANEFMRAGYYEIPWISDQLRSGIYLGVIRTDSQKATIRMSLVR